MNINSEKIKQAATYANLTPQIAGRLRDFFLHTGDKNGEREIDEWMNASPANEHLFDILVEVNREGIGAPQLEMLVKIAKRKTSPWPRIWRGVKFGLLVLVAILLLDYFIPTHPLSRLVYGVDPADRDLDQTTITTAEASRTIWLADSTKIELQPHSMARYPNELSWSTRKLKIAGNVLVTVRGSLETPFRLEAGEFKIETYKDALIRYENDKLTLEALHP